MCATTRYKFIAKLRHDILRPLKLKHYKSLESAFHDALKVEEDLKEETFYKAKVSLTSSLSKGNEKWKRTYREQVRSSCQVNLILFNALGSNEEETLNVNALLEEKLCII
ncbi:hypothetical protein RDI58_022047 [Solanum bulbocastanum]|uniref:Uncharacterized protein n=1 Tax=Solanum bulbocastanum TaxID=147425 RepID=A0AAN8Y7Q5_SOLBU